jgi:predicted small integral membrane protein
VGLVALDNISDSSTNRAFVEHVLAMDTTFGSPNTRWRAITDHRLITVAYLAIIVWETSTAIVLTVAFLCWLREIFMQRGVVMACQLSTCGWLMQMILFGGGFIVIGGEWFQMWQSSEWNGLQSAFQNFLIASIGFILIQDFRKRAGGHDEVRAVITSRSVS